MARLERCITCVVDGDGCEWGVFPKLPRCNSSRLDQSILSSESWLLTSIGQLFMTICCDQLFWKLFCNCYIRLARPAWILIIGSVEVDNKWVDITLHYRHFKRHLHLKWPVVHQQLHVIPNTAHRPSSQASSYTASRVRPKRKISCAEAQIAATQIAATLAISFPRWRPHEFNVVLRTTTDKFNVIYPGQHGKTGKYTT